MDNEENIIEQWELGPDGISQAEFDLYDDLIDSTISGDHGRASVLNQLIKSEEQGLPGTQAWLDQSAALRGGELGSSEAPPILQGALPGYVSGISVDNAGLLNRLVDWDMVTGRGDDPDRGIIDYFTNTFKGAISGEHDQGEMFISWDEYYARPDLREYLKNAEEGLKENAISLMNKFMEDKKFRTEEEFEDWKRGMFTREVNGELTDEEQKDFDYVNKLQSQRQEGARPFKATDEGIIITSDLLPDVRGEPDPKFVDGRLHMPYFGTLERDAEGNLNMPAASAFRFTDNPGIPGLAEKYAPGAEKAFGDYLYPKISPYWDYGESRGEQLGYQLGQMGSAANVLRSIGKAGYKGGKGLYNLARRKLFGYQPVDTSNWKLSP